MSDLVACPTCRSTLRLPAGARTVRCPKCKTTLEVLGDEPASPPPPPKPLPFAPPAKRPKPPVTAKPVSRKHRPQVVDEALEAEEVKAEEAKREAERRRRVRKELREFDLQEDAEADRYDEIDEQCLWGRRALATLRWSLLGYLGALVFGYMILLPLVGIGWIFKDKEFMAGVGALASAASMAVTFGSSLGLAVAFVLAFRGPPQAVHTAIIGLAVTVLHLGFYLATAAAVFTAPARHAAAQDASPGYAGMELAYVLLGTGSNLQAVGDAPTRYGFHFANAGSYDLSWVNVACGILEFTRLLLVCQLVQRYGELAKSERAAAECGKTVARVFGVLLVFALFRAAACVGFDWFPPDNFMWYIGQGVHIALFEVPFLIIGVRLLTQSRVTSDTEELLIADRVASGFDTFSEV